MNFRHIVENGYYKLAEKLPKENKAVLDCIDYLGKDLESAFETYCEFEFEEGSKIAELKKEILTNFVGWYKEYLETMHDELLVSFVEDNDYSIDEKGNIVKEEKENV